MRRQYYAKTWPLGYVTREIFINNQRLNRNEVCVYAFDSAKERDEFVEGYYPPNHCPSAFAEAVKARDEDVQRIKRSEDDEFKYYEGAL